MQRVVDLARNSRRPDHAVIATDARGHIVYWDEGAERLYGWTGREVLGRPIVEITPADLSRAQAAEIMAALTEGKPWSGEFTVRDRDGRRFEASVSNVPVRDDDGSVVGVVGVSRRMLRVRPPARLAMPIG